METRNYYEAYDDRYRQVHGLGLNWSSMVPTGIVTEVMNRHAVTGRILEIGCGEGRDAVPLLDRRYDVLATDLSPEAISWCRNRFPRYKERFACLDCLRDRLAEKFDFIYAVAVLHILVEDGDRQNFFRFFRDQLTDSGIGLICTMGDGHAEFSSDTALAFQRQERIHQESGRRLSIAGTSCRVVSGETFFAELKESGLEILELGMTQSPPDFSRMLYAVVKR